MRVTEVNERLNKPAFKGQREDNTNISSLANSSNPILPNRKRNILTALANVAKTPDDNNLTLLLNTAEGLKYGLMRNSEFAQIIDSSSNISGDKQNTKWDELLDQTIQNALHSSNSKHKPEFEEQYKKIFKEQKPLTEQEKNILELRSDILHSKEMTDVLSDSAKLAHATNISENLDYFIASSEISKQQKQECLGKIKYFFSDDYKIDAQLKDKKLQAMDEILNDMLIKTPKSPILTIKDVNQRESGTCADISIARKMLAYEDKSKYMDILLGELDDKDTMSVYDVTELGSGKKVSIKKPHVDYNHAQKRGYRILMLPRLCGCKPQAQLVMVE